jgi:hypothetical protein
VRPFYAARRELDAPETTPTGATYATADRASEGDMSGNDIIQIIAVTVMGGISLIVTSHVGRAFQRWMETRSQPRPPLDEARLVATLDELRDRMAQLQQTVDASAVELERIAEGDRYIAKLVSDRVPASIPASLPAPRPERVITPH